MFLHVTKNNKLNYNTEKMLRRGTGWVNDGKRIRRGRAEVEED
jgi:hypothetical protein